VLAAAARYALANNRARMHEDHENARRLHDRLREATSFVVHAPETNIVNIDTGAPAEAIAARAKERGLLIAPSAPTRLRAVTHLDVSREGVERAAEILAACVA
jgi:threonine aldolase